MCEVVKTKRKAQYGAPEEIGDIGEASELGSKDAPPDGEVVPTPASLEARVQLTARGKMCKTPSGTEAVLPNPRVNHLSP